MLAVDEMIADLFKTLEASGELENTYVIFTSDQGFTLGQHRLLRGKSSMYEEDIVVPFIVRGPGIPAGGSIEPFLAGMIDIAPTIAEWGGIIPPAFVDGRSFASTLLNGNVPADWRNGFLLQQYSFNGEEEVFIPGMLNLFGLFRAGETPSYSAGIRTLQYTYIEHPDGFVELYDLEQDPYQMENIASTAAPSLITDLSNWLSQLKNCQSEECRILESQTAP
jgi:arylsulfatase A-like enzyme